jgi:hypothetical protein
MIELGARLLLQIGPTQPVPAPFEVTDSLLSAQVQLSAQDRGVFQLEFELGRTLLGVDDYELLKDGLLSPPNRVSIQLLIGATLEPLIVGVITAHQYIPSSEPGQAKLVVTGEDIGVLMDLEVPNQKTTHPESTDSAIVESVLSNRKDLRLLTAVTSTSDARAQADGVTTQQVSDRRFVADLAEKHGFVFFLEALPGGMTQAYWGPYPVPGPPQPALTMNQGAANNVDSLSFSYDALRPTTPVLSIIEPRSHAEISVLVPPIGYVPPLNSRLTPPLRKGPLRRVANLDALLAALAAIAEQKGTQDAISGNGQLDTVRYGHVLRPGRTVAVRGVGASYDGLYYVREVSHTIRRGSYMQSFSLLRPGLGTTLAVVPT